MEKSTKITKNKQKGITLIALIITIIVLLILAGVTIAQITGNENAMDKAVEAKEANDLGVELDALRGKSPWTVKAISGKEYDISERGEVADATPKPAGLYNDNGYTPWEKLVEDGVVSVSNNKLTVSNKNAINGDLIITNDGTVTSLNYNAFNDCINLTGITIPEGVTRIGENAFEGCSTLTSIMIPEGVTNIPNNLFKTCRGLTTVPIPTSVTSIGKDVFGITCGLTTVNYTGTTAQWEAITIGTGNTKLTNATIICNDTPQS